VTVENLTVLSGPDSNGNYVLSDNLGLSPYLLESDFSGISNGDNFSSITGIFDVNFDKPSILPKSASDVVKD